MFDPPNILIVEDDREIRSLVARYLGANNCRVATAGDGRDMDRLMARERFDLVILDLMLPGEDGFDICRRLDGPKRTPVIMLTARSEESDRVIGLELGADDYLTKPFEPRELLARIRAVLRRTQRPPEHLGEPPARSLHFQGFTLEVAARRLTGPDGGVITLTGAEFDLLVVLAENAERTMSRDELLRATHGRAAAAFERSVDILISRIRRKIETDPAHPTMVRTIRSGGYLFTPRVTIR